MGKKKPAKDIRKHAVMVRFTDEEYQRVMESARRSHEPIAIYLRRKLLTAQKGE